VGIRGLALWDTVSQAHYVIIPKSSGMSMAKIKGTGTVHAIGAREHRKGEFYVYVWGKTE
jgi:hypothetical protein